MPPRYAYWTILIDQKPTAFRAGEREELLPTFHQLRRKNADVVMKWFARGRLWESPLEAQAARQAPKAEREPRGRDWRPGGDHRDPRDRFKSRAKTPKRARPDRPGEHPKGKHAWRDPKAKPLAARDRRSSVPQGKDKERQKPWQRERSNPRRRSQAPPGRLEPDIATPAEQIVTKREPPERG